GRSARSAPVSPPRGCLPSWRSGTPTPRGAPRSSRPRTIVRAASEPETNDATARSEIADVRRRRRSSSGLLLRSGVLLEALRRGGPDSVGDLGLFDEQLGELSLADDVEHCWRGGHDGGGARSPFDQRDLTDVVARTAGRDHLVAPTDLHLPFEDDDELVARAALTCEDASGLHVDSGGEAPDLPKVPLGEVPEERHAGEELIRRGSGHLCCSRSPAAAGNASQRAGPAPEESPAASSLEGGFRLQCVGQRVGLQAAERLAGLAERRDEAAALDPRDDAATLRRVLAV